MTYGNTDYVLTAGTTNAALTTGSNEQLLFLRVTVCNVDSAPHNITVWRVPQGGSTSTGEILVDAYPIQPAPSPPVTLPFGGKSLVNGQSLYASTDAGSVLNLSMDFQTTP